MKYIDVIEELSNSANLHKGDIKSFSKEVLKISCKVLKCERTNIWLFNSDQTVLHSINSFDSVSGMFVTENSLHQSELPNYFNYLTKNKIIISEEAVKCKMNAELIETYLKPNNISSMVDVPLRSAGKMVGVICFENVGKIRNWSAPSRKFAQSVAQLLSLAFETNKKNIYRKELEKTIKQKEILLHEINHRVKNNMAVIIGLINLQKNKIKDSFHEGLMEELKEKIYSMSIVQNQLHNNKNLVTVELSQHLNEVINNLHQSYGYGKNIQLKLELEKVMINISKAVPLGLIANEILTNSFKYAFTDKNKRHLLCVEMHRIKNEVVLIFKDDGSGYKDLKTRNGVGLELVKDLTEQIEGEFSMQQKNGVETKIVFNANK